MARVGLMFGGRSVEHLVSVQSARTVFEGLRGAGHEVIPLGIAEDGVLVSEAVAMDALTGKTAAIKPAGGSIPKSLARLMDADLDVVFPIIHGAYGEDGTLQGLCAMADIPCVGANVGASAVCMDKRLTKRVLEAAGLAVVEYRVVTSHDLATDRDGAFARIRTLKGPWFVKPALGGSSVGCRPAKTDTELEDAIAFALQFDDAVLVERAVKARELECAVLGRPGGGIDASAIGEIVPAAEFYDYADKYIDDKAGLVAPAEIPDEIRDAIKSRAVEAFASMGGTGMARVDFFWEKDRGLDGLYVNEINTLPGFTRISMYPRLWGLSGVPLAELTDRLVKVAVAEHEAKRRLDESVLRWVAAQG